MYGGLAQPISNAFLHGSAEAQKSISILNFKSGFFRGGGLLDSSHVSKLTLPSLGGDHIRRGATKDRKIEGRKEKGGRYMYVYTGGMS